MIESPSRGVFTLMKTITCDELKEWMDSGKKFQLIDVREDLELNYGIIDGSEHIKMSEVMDNLEKIRKDAPIVVYCRSGNRSEIVSLTIEKEIKGVETYNLVGGILSWKKFDPNIQEY